MAATVKVFAGLVTYVAAPGETNRVVFSLSGSTYTVSDHVTSLTAADGCQSVAPRTVTCAAAGISGLYADLSDGDDSLENLTATGINAQGGKGRDYIRGGSGDDVLLGQEDGNWLFGGAGNDILVGGDFIDELRGEAGNDYLSGGDSDDDLYGNAGNDIVDGGAHTWSGDRLHYEDAPCSVVLDSQSRPSRTLCAAVSKPSRT